MVQLTELTEDEQRELESKREPTITSTDRICVYRRPYAHILTNSQVFEVLSSV